MGVLDKVVAAITPEASKAEMAEARQQALALGNPWLSMVIEHHEQIEAAFANVKKAKTAITQRNAQKKLAALLTGHSIAEESVLYPAMALSDQKGHSGEAYTEQSAAKVQAAALENLTPLSKDYMDKLEHLRAAVAHHVFEEESEWFPKLCEAGDKAMQKRLAKRYGEEFARYTGT